MSDIIFRAQMTEGILFKKLIELFSQSFSSLVLTINREGLFSRVANSQQAMLFDLSLTRDNFSEYILEDDCVLFFGINILHTHKVISSMKKKDSIKFEIHAREPQKLRVTIYPKGHDYIDTGFVVMENIQLIEIDLPVGYSTFPIRGVSSKFGKMCKELHSVSKDVRVRGGSKGVTFQTLIEGVISKETQYGNSAEEEIDEIYRIQDFLKLSKLSSISPAIYFYVKMDLPFCIGANIGLRGKLMIYIQNKQRILESLENMVN